MLSDEFGQASLSWQKFPRPKLAKLRPGFKLGCVNFRCRQPAIVILKSRPEWTRFRGTPPNLEVHFGNSDPLSRGPLGSKLKQKNPRNNPLNVDPSGLASRRVSAVPPVARSSIHDPLDPEAKRTDAHENGSWEAALPPFQRRCTVR